MVGVLAAGVLLACVPLLKRVSTRSVASSSLSSLVSFSRCASTRASASPTRCFSLVISANVDIECYHHDATAATAECADLFCSPIYRRGRVPRKLLVEPDVFYAPILQNAGTPAPPVSRPSVCTTTGLLSATI